MSMPRPGTGPAQFAAPSSERLQSRGRNGIVLKPLPRQQVLCRWFYQQQGVPDEQNSVVSVRFKLDEIDAIANLHTNE